MGYHETKWLEIVEIDQIVVFVGGVVSLGFGRRWRCGRQFGWRDNNVG